MFEDIFHEGFEIFLKQCVFHFLGRSDFDEGEKGKMGIVTYGKVGKAFAYHLDNFFLILGDGDFDTLPFCSGGFLL